MSLVCRTCLKLTTNTSNIFTDDLPAKIETISSVKILPDDGFPSQICNDCLDKVNLSYQFRSDIITSDEILKSRVDEEMKSKSVEVEDDSPDYLFSLDDLEDDVEIDPEEKKIVDLEIELEHEKENNCKVGKMTKVYRCKYCDFESLKSSDVTTHKKNVVHEEVEQRTCTICGKIISIANYQAHVNLIHKGLPVSCQVCENVLKNKATLRNHMCITHRENNSGKYHIQMTGKIEESVCTICGVLVRKDNFSKHVASHQKDPPVSCDICGKVVKNNTTLKSHMRVHQNNTFQCSLCGKVYKYKQGYDVHMKKHAAGDNITVKCPVCNKRFCNKNVLSKHIRTHTRDRPYPCLFCNQEFSSSVAFKNHIRQHTEEKPYSCNQCNMTFIHKVSLKSHIKSKHPEAEDC